MIRAVTYARVSGDDRNKDGRNLAGQLKLGREYARERGYRIIEEISEDEKGASGALWDLPGLNKVLKMAFEGKYDVLLVRELDRFARKLAKQVIVEEELKRAGVKVEYLLGDFPDTPEGRFNKNVKITLAEYEREKIKERTMRGRRLKVEAGSVLIPKGQAPYGYTVVKKQNKWALKVVDAEADIIRMIFTWYTVGDEGDGPMTIYQIAGRLTELSVPTFADVRAVNKPKKSGHGEWGCSSVASILKNETYAGIWHYGKRPHGENGNNKEGRISQPKVQCLTVKVPAIISKEVWRIAQMRLAYNLKNSPRNTSQKYLLRRRVKCGRCGLKMAARTYKNNRGKKPVVSYYCCPSNHKYSTVRVCDAPHFRADYIDTLAWEWVKNLILDPKILDEGLKIYQESKISENAPLLERIDVIEGIIADYQEQLERVIDLYVSGTVGKEMVVDRQKQLEKNVAALTDEKILLTEQLERRTLTQEEITTIKQLTERVAKGLNLVDNNDDFETRQSIIEALDVTASVIVEDGRRIAYLKCKIGETTAQIISNPTPNIVLYAGSRILLA
jgi:site-specific DNA recombinase